MDDMDKEAEELGGKAKFFTDDLKDFAWSKLLDTRYSGQERMDLYVRAISAFAKAKQLPQLFRDIFKDAFLPYRDPETLSLFLKEIDNFTYDHSEDLGNAFEYLLSVLGSQGDAGQFRTPRHIIDFIVAVVDPKKNETVLDPACGTAGFLISAYKHIRKHNSSNFKPEKERAEEKLPEGETIAETVLAEKTYRGDQLTPSERGKLMSNFVGYDISPDMVKLSLVNMYLHGFSDPKIYEYDTLTSEKHWGEQFDVIMANPPFMSPKGGIRPHKRFSVQASRSEVLFVDYILEHLNLKGRAGIIVPEGIIFKTENAYKQLREMLIEDGLFAVVSLPPGVFNPYSGVKTSILLFDNEHAKKSDEILFLKIKDDGFDLGAQRRKIDKNDLPEALEVLEAWKQGKKKESDIALWVKKEKIAESGDYNLTGERYRETEIRKNQKWPLVELDEVCEIYQPKTITSKEIKKSGPYKVFGANGVIGFYDKYNHEEAEVLITCRGATCGTVNMSEPKSWITGNAMVVKPKDDRIDKYYLYYFLRHSNLNPAISGTAQPQITRKSLAPFKIPLPPLEVQKEIVEQIEVKQNAINHAKEIIKNLERERRYFGQELRKLEDVELVPLGDVVDYEQPTKYIVKSTNYKDEYTTPVLTAGQTFILGYTDEKEGVYPKENLPVIIFDDFTTATKFVDFPFKVKSSAMKILSVGNKKKANIKFIFLAMQDIKFDASRHKRYWIAEYSKIKIPLPPLEVQKQLVAEAEKEEEIIASNRRLIEIMEDKIGAVLEEI
jgi:type I restriction enzyme M protein